MHMLPGRVTAIDEHHAGKHATVTITHGKRKRTKGSDGPGELVGYDQPSSRVTMSKKHAANYALGQRVPGTEEDEQQGDDNDAETPEPTAKGGKQNAPTRAPIVKRNANERPILKALTRRGKK